MILSASSLHTATKPRRRKRQNDVNVFTREKLTRWRAFDNRQTVCRLTYIILYVVIMVALIQQFNQVAFFIDRSSPIGRAYRKTSPAVFRKSSIPSATSGIIAKTGCRNYSLLTPWHAVHRLGRKELLETLLRLLLALFILRECFRTAIVRFTSSSTNAPSHITIVSERQIADKYYQSEKHYPRIPIAFLWRPGEEENLIFYTRTRLVDKSRQMSFPLW